MCKKQPKGDDMWEPPKKKRKLLPSKDNFIAPPPLRRSTRRKKGKPVNSLDAYLFGKPKYESCTDFKAGGKHSSFKLGPNSVSSMGSDADSKLPKGITDAKNEYSIEFVAGHLLNADFYGVGKNYKNLTILTPKGNSNHKSFDGPIKIAAMYLRKVYKTLYNNYFDITQLNLGIQVDVSVSDIKWSLHPPRKYITQFLICSAKIDGQLTEEQSTLVKSDYQKMKNQIDKANLHSRIENLP